MCECECVHLLRLHTVSRVIVRWCYKTVNVVHGKGLLALCVPVHTRGTHFI